MNWEPWTGCYQISDGCANCYFYGPYAKRCGQNTILKTDKFNWPIRRNKKGEYNIKGDKILATCSVSYTHLDVYKRQLQRRVMEEAEWVILPQAIQMIANS